eukprot:16430930-Heterocapsa_arctica.AAC.1
MPITTEPKSLRKQDGSWRGLCPSVCSAPAFLGIQSRRSTLLPNTLARCQAPRADAWRACPMRCAVKCTPK